VAAVDADRARRRLAVAACGGRRVRSHVAPPDRTGEIAAWQTTLPEQRHGAEGARGVDEPLAQVGDRARPDADGVALEVERDELGERQVGHRRWLAAQLRFDDLAVIGERLGPRRERALAATDAVGVVPAEAPPVSAESVGRATFERAASLLLAFRDD
jgi:hypothetical protein